MYVCVYIYIYIYRERERMRPYTGPLSHGLPRTKLQATNGLAFTRYCNCQYYMVYSIQRGGRKGSLILW